MNGRAVRALVRRDLAVVARSRPVVLPIVVLPLLFFVVLPAGLVLLAGTIGGDLSEFEDLVAVMPGLLREELAPYEPSVQVVLWGLEYAFVGLFLIVPLMTSAVIAADSFAGEKERKTLEAIVYTPVTDAELYLGKVAAPWIAAVAVAGFGYLVFALVGNALAGGMVGRPVAVTARWLIVVLVVAPGIAALAVGALVQVSARVRGFQEAYQLGGLVVLPVVVLLVGQLSGAVYLDVAVLAAIAAGVWVVAAAALAYGYRTFRRERLIVQLS